MIGKLIGLLVALTAMAVPAAAADLGSNPGGYVLDTTPATRYFDGLYAGASVNWESLDYSDDVRFGGASIKESLTQDSHGTSGSAFGAGLRLGYDRQVADWLVIGAGAELDGIGSPSGSAAYHQEDCPHCSGSADVEKQWSWDLFARAGVPVGRALFYGKVSWGQAKFKADGTVDCPWFENPENGSDSDVVSGLGLGGGLEVALTDHVRAFAEYTHYDYGTAHFQKDEVGYDADPKLDVVKTGLNYRF